MHRNVLHLGPFAAFLLSVGCAEPPVSLRDVTAHDGLRLDVSLERAIIPVGDSSAITIRLLNETARSIRVSFGSGCQILPFIETQEGEITYPGGGDWGCTAALTSLEIPAHGVVARTIVARGVARAEGLDGASLPPGGYRAYALLGDGPRALLLRSPAVAFEVR